MGSAALFAPFLTAFLAIPSERGRLYALASEAYSGALPNGMPLILIDRWASNSTSQLRLPSLSLFASPLASARPGMALAEISGPKSLTAAIVLSKLRAWIVIAAVGLL